MTCLDEAEVEVVEEVNLEVLAEGAEETLTVRVTAVEVEEAVQLPTLELTKRETKSSQMIFARK